MTVAARVDVERMTADHLAQQSASHLEAATGSDKVRQLNLLGAGFTGLDGTGIGIAVLDSGIMSSHSDFSNWLGLSRVTASTDIVSSNSNLAQFEIKLGLLSLGLNLNLLGSSNADAYGHGSHVAGTAAGRSIGSGTSRGFEGSAPNANLIDVRVLDGSGLGQISDVIAGIDWVIDPKSLYNIRVMNLSLGATSSESYITDPLCRAARRAVAAGITVVAAGGNYGASPNGLERYGSITAPGDDPSVITVGAVNTHQTDGRADDSVTYFSSRGPTRGSFVDESSVKHYDNLLKPDVIAPGNRIVSVESRGSWFAQNYPQSHTSGSTTAFMQMSGTSIAAPVVAGAVALLLQKNPGLTPPLIKAILQFTAQQTPSSNICQQGAGLLNVEGAARLAGALRTDIAISIARGSMNVGDSLLRTGVTMPTPVSTIAGQTVSWGGYITAGGSHEQAVQQMFEEIRQAHAKMERDQEEIERVKADTREILARLKAA